MLAQSTPSSEWQKQFIGKKDIRPITQNITLVVEDDTLTASAINGMSLGVIKFYKVKIDDCKWQSRCCRFSRASRTSFAESLKQTPIRYLKHRAANRVFREATQGQLIEYERYLPKKNRP